MSDNPAGVSVEEARRHVLRGLRKLGAEDVALDAALGRVLATDVVARGDLPAADNSSMDGYAVVAADLAHATETSSVVLPVRGEARAGRPITHGGPGTAVLIATGALLPSGADSIVPVEATSSAPGGVAFSQPTEPGSFVRRRGEDVHTGDVLLAAGCRLRSVDVGACAAAGVDRVSVARRPRVALLSTGDELVAPGVAPEAHQVTDINTAMLTAAVLEAGGVTVPLGVVTDDRDAVSAALVRARDSADLIVSSAGVSMGEHDHVRQCVAELGSVDIWKVAMRPGRPLVVGSVGDTPFLGLPGNPVSSAVTFLLFARAAILALQGATTLLPHRLTAVLGDDVDKPAHLETYVRVRLESSGDQLVARASGGQGSAMMHALATADALAILPAGSAHLPASTAVEVMLIP